MPARFLRPPATFDGAARDGGTGGPVWSCRGSGAAAQPIPASGAAPDPSSPAWAAKMDV